jgi:hypothetical protein
LTQLPARGLRQRMDSRCGLGQDEFTQTRGDDRATPETSL